MWLLVGIEVYAYYFSWVNVLAASLSKLSEVCQDGCSHDGTLRAFKVRLCALGP